jgi:hypothetical protein
MLPEDGRRPKHVGAFKYFSVCFLNTENISAFVGFSCKIEIEMHGATMKIIQFCFFPVRAVIILLYHMLMFCANLSSVH